MRINHFQRDHDQIKRDLETLHTLADRGIAANAAEIAAQLLAMSAHIKIHLTSEDRTLYPKLAASGDATVVAMATRYQNEMSGLFDAFKHFVENWRIADRLKADPEGFRASANQVLKALHDRLHREEAEFFPAVEARLASA